MAPVEAPVQVGEDAPRLARTPETQLRFGLTPRAMDFQRRWGSHHVRWDERNGTPRALLGPGLPASVTLELVAAIARLGAVRPDSLVLEEVRSRGERETWVFTQHHLGAPITGGGVVVHVRSGRIGLVMASLHLPKETGHPEAGEELLPANDPDTLGYTWVRRQEQGDLVRFVDRAGAEVHAWTTRMHLDLTTEERTVGDPLIQVPVRQVFLQDAEARELTDDDGLHSRTPPYDVMLEGPSLLVRLDKTPIELTGIEDELLDWEVDLSPAASTVQHHFHVAWDWLRDRRPDHPWLDRQVTASVEVPGECNAFYTNGTINFYQGGDRCEDFGRIADVVYHELGHGFHHYVIEEGTFAGDISEGSSDFVSATLLDDPVLAPGATGEGSYIREIDTDRIYPDDVRDETHADGLIWASMFWNLRERWIDTYGAEDGTRMVDELLLEALSYGPTLTDAFEAVIAADDDDGDLSNSTPHACELIELLNHHGLGPGSLGLVRLDHEPVGAQGSFVPGYAVDFSLTELTPECGSLDTDSVRLHYTVDLPRDVLDLETTSFVEVVPDRDGEDYATTIPRQLPGSEVSYALSWASGDGLTAFSTHFGDASRLWRFWVGDREALWCETFERGFAGFVGEARVFGRPPQEEWSSEWEVDTPLGQDWNPTGPWAGRNVVGTAVTGEGLYGSGNGQRLVSTDVPLHGASPRLLLLSAQRWLTVEDARYDEAQVWVAAGGDPLKLWGNSASEGGSEHTLDTAWTPFDLDLRQLVDEPDPLVFSFTLQSDGGLEFGGWALDDLCVVTLADEVGHYRVRDLVATDDEPEVRISWTQPMIEPLEATVLVRKQGGWPEHAEDGLIVDLDLAPVPGAALSVVDPETDQGVVYHYALFAAPAGDTFFSDVIEGDNADLGGAPPPVVVDSGDTADSGLGDTATDTEEEDDRVRPPPGVVPVEDGPCGCATRGSSWGGSGWLLALALWRRRRSR